MLEIIFFNHQVLLKTYLGASHECDGHEGAGHEGAGQLLLTKEKKIRNNLFLTVKSLVI